MRKYEDYLKRQNEMMAKSRNHKQVCEQNLPIPEQTKLQRDRRENTRTRVGKCRALLKKVRQTAPQNSSLAFNSVDGTGGTVKRVVCNDVRNRKTVVNDAASFTSATGSSRSSHEDAV